jgi:hypothetical protein
MTMTILLLADHRSSLPLCPTMNYVAKIPVQNPRNSFSPKIMTTLPYSEH